MLVDLSIKEFLDETSSSSPAPAGGSVYALTGSLAGSLTLMVANLSTDSEEIISLRQKGEQALEKLKKYIDEDTLAFSEVMKSYKLPKTTAEEKALRSTSIQSALKKASLLPLSIAESCVDVLDLAVKAIQYGNPNAVSDGAVAGRIAYSGMWGAIYNVRINLSSIKDENFVSETREKIVSLIKEGEKLLAEIVALADNKIGG